MSKRLWVVNVEQTLELDLVIAAETAEEAEREARRVDLYDRGGIPEVFVGHPRAIEVETDLPEYTGPEDAPDNDQRGEKIASYLIDEVERHNREVMKKQLWLGGLG
jgi:hypothetical protein